MRSLKQFFQYLHGVDFPYVVLRNFEGLPNHLTEGHEDIDILVYDLNHFRELFPDMEIVHDLPRVMHRIKIADEWVYIDARHVGDDYYPERFEKELLNTREWDPKGFYTPNPYMFRLALAYHVVHHKNYNAYGKWLGKCEVRHLLEALKASEIGFIPPKDPTVGRFNQYFKGATSVVDKKDGSVKKQQTSFNAYNLITNEARILKMLNGKHFPKLICLDDDGIEIEDCGERITVENLPEDWIDQLIQILSELEEKNIIHRDIKPDNLMVKDGVIKLIDFGWAKLKGEVDNPPECLGYPYKPTDHYSDSFSMRKVIKEIEYKMETICV